MDTSKNNLFSVIDEINKDEKKKTNLLFIIFIILFVSFAAYSFFLKKDDSKPIDEEKYCVFNQQEYEIGDVFDVDCNTCVCTESGISCTFKICDAKCIESDKQCIGQQDGSLCILGVWCDEQGKVCGGEICKDLGLGICIKEKCAGD